MKDVLGIQPTDINATLLDTCYSLIEEGIIKKNKKYRGPKKPGEEDEGKKELVEGLINAQIRMRLVG